MSAFCSLSRPLLCASASKYTCLRRHSVAELCPAYWEWPPLLNTLHSLPNPPPLPACRDAASAELEVHALEEAQAACLRVNQLGERPDVYGPLAERLRHISEWLKQRASVGLKDQGRDFHEGVWAGQQVCNGLAVLGGQGLLHFRM